MESSTEEAKEPEQSATENSIGGLRAEITKLIEGERLGSVASKAFCDFVDYESLAMPKALGKDPIGETIRQRINEIPGYLGVREKVAMLSSKLIVRFKEDILKEGQYSDPITVTGMASYRVNGVLGGIKLEHLRSQQDLNTSTESVTPLTQPAPSV